MRPSLETRASLLVRLRNPQDTEAWQQFFELYSSIVYGYARKRGLQDADAADLMQDVLRAVARNVGRLEYDPARGSFRAWLHTITRNKVFNHLNSQRRHARGSGDSGQQALLDQQPLENERDDDWDRDYQRQLFRLACEKIEHEFQPNTWKAFWQTAVEGKNPREVSKNLGLSTGAIYVAKSRVLARLRDVVKTFDDEKALVNGRGDAL